MTDLDSWDSPSYAAVSFPSGGRVAKVLDQLLLPWSETYVTVGTWQEMADAIATMKVRGAPAIGVAAAYGMVLAALEAPVSGEAFLAAMRSAGQGLVATRPTAVNLAWAVDVMLRHAQTVMAEEPSRRAASCLERARAIHSEDIAACKAMGAASVALFPDEGTVLTHCNAGALATGGYGTALGLLRAAREHGKRLKVLASETRPFLQGARLTAWELQRDGFDVSLVTDNMVGYLLARGDVSRIVVGADRVARNGDVANKIGTYGLACLAHMHGVPLIVAAPTSTVDLATPTGAHIPIEQRNPREVLELSLPGGAVAIAPDGVSALNPSFDVTPAAYVSALVTERGVVSPVDEASLVALMAR